MQKKAKKNAKKKKIIAGVYLVPGGVPGPGGVPAQVHPLWTEWQTHVKT